MRPSKSALIWSLVTILFFVAYASGQSGRLRWVLLFGAVFAGGRAVAKVRNPPKAHARRMARYLVDVSATPMPAIKLVAELRSFGDLVPHAAIRQLENLPARVEMLSNEPNVEDLERRLQALGVVASIVPLDPQ